MADASPQEIVEAFCASVDALDLDVVIDFLAEDCVYHNIPMDPVVGHDAIRVFLESFTTGLSRLQFEMLNVAADGDTVLTERVDHFVSPERTISLPVMGTFEVKDGKIAAWRDYFDLNQFMSQMT
jgi:limonene-1,2-epoxide hydrolase